MGLNGNGEASWKWRGSMEMEWLNENGGVRWKWRGSMEREGFDGKGEARLKWRRVFIEANMQDMTWSQ